MGSPFYNGLSKDNKKPAKFNGLAGLKGRDHYPEALKNAIL